MPRQLASTEMILDAATALAREHGLDSISIRGVATASGMSVGTIYNYFPSRDELVAAAAERLFSDAFREGFCHASAEEGYLAYCERLYASLRERLSGDGSDWLRQLQGLEPGAREAGRRRMDELLGHMLDGLESVMAADPRVRGERLAGDLGAKAVCRLTLNAMFDAVRRDDPDCRTLLALLRRALYEE